MAGIKNEAPCNEWGRHIPCALMAVEALSGAKRDARALAQ